jgi:SAM-dependent methyltransferase
MQLPLKNFVIQRILNMALRFKLRKVRLNRAILNIASLFVDYEAEALPPDSRIIEYGYALSKLVKLPIGKALDVGCIARHNYLVPTLCFAGWKVYGIDIRPKWGFNHPNFNFSHQDIRDGNFKDNGFDLITCISTIEHIGLASYYGETQEDNDGDFKAAKEMVRILKPNGIIIVTVPYRDIRELKPGYRIYDGNIIDMFKGMELLDEIIYVDVKDEWIPADRNLKKEGVICLTLQKSA